MRRTAIVMAAIASLTLMSACGGDDADDAADTTDTSQSEDTGGDEPSEPAESEPADTGGGDATVLIGLVGTEEDPDAFEISLTDESGEPVEELPAGDYTIQINDPTAIHNFHLMGGDVDEATTVDEVTEVTWDVTLTPGEYEFVCDPHPPMSGSFTVV